MVGYGEYVCALSKAVTVVLAHIPWRVNCTSRRERRVGALDSKGEIITSRLSTTGNWS